MKARESKTPAVQAKVNTTTPGKGGERAFFSSQPAKRGFFRGGAGASSGAPIQRKLTIGKPNDVYEKEADHMAGKVLQKLSTSSEVQAKPRALTAGPTLPPITPIRSTEPLQEKCADCEKEEIREKEQSTEELRKKPIFESNAEPPDDGLQRKCADCEREDGLQRKPIFESESEPPDQKIQAKQENGQAAPSSDLEQRLAVSKSGGSSLPEETRSSMEGAFGADFSGVRIHAGNDAQRMSSELGAKAFTTGKHIYFGAGQLNTTSTEGKSLLAHELTHTIQQGASAKTAKVQRKTVGTSLAAAGHSPGTADRSSGAADHSSGAADHSSGAADRSSGTAISTVGHSDGVVQRGLLDTVAGGLGAAWDATGGKLVNAAGEVIEMGEEFFWDLLNKAAPGIAAIIRKISQIGIIGFLKEEVKGAVGHIFDGLDNAAGMLAQISPQFATLLLKARMIVAALARGDCKPLFAALEQLKLTLSELAGEVWTKISNFFAPVGEFFEGVWTSIGAPFVDWIKKTAGDVWDGIKAIGTALWDQTAPVRNALAKAWDWIKGKLGFNYEDTGEEGLLQWVERKASEAWEELKAEMEPVIAPMRAMVNYVRKLIPLDEILHLRETIDGWLDKAMAMGDAMGADGQGVGAAKQQISLRDEILPAMLAFVGRLRLRLISAGNWVSEKIGSIGASVKSFFATLASNSLLSGFSGVINWLRDEVDKLVAWAQGTVQRVFTALGDAMVYLSKFIRPVLDLLTKIVGVLGDLLGKIPDLIMGPVWWVLPDCIKNPIKNFLLEQILGRMPFFKKLKELGNIWDKLENAALLGLKQVFVDGNLAGAIWTFFSTMLDILKIPPKLIAGIIKKGASVLKDILNAPLDFLINFLHAMKAGFDLFFGNIWTHLLNGLATWLTGQLEGTGIKLPKDFSLKEIFKFVCSVLDITLDKILTKIETATGKKGLKAKIQRYIALGSKALGWLADLFKDGPSGIWDNLVKQVGNLWDMILNGVAGWIEKTLVGQAIKWVAEKLDPTGIMAVITSIIDFFNVVAGIANQARQILEIVDHTIDGIGDIIKGRYDIAAPFIERVLAGAIPVVMTLLGYLFGISDVGEEVEEVVTSLREKVDEGIDWLIKEGMELFNSLFGSGDDDKKDDTIPEVEAALDSEDKNIAPDGNITKEQADKVATTVYGKESHLVKSITVIDGDDSWDYEYVQLAKKKGDAKGEGNEEYIKKFLDKLAPDEPPRGYDYYDEKPDGSFKIRRKEANDKLFVKLAIKSESTPSSDEADGESGVENKIIKGEEGSVRISTPGRLAKNVGGSPKNHQFHHLIPDAVVRGSELMKLARDKTGYDLDRGSNGIRMPCDEIGKKTTDLPIHFGSHPSYNNRVSGKLDVKMGELMKESKGDEDSIKESRIKTVVSETENEFREYIEGNPVAKLN